MIEVNRREKSVDFTQRLLSNLRSKRSTEETRIENLYYVPRWNGNFQEAKSNQIPRGTYTLLQNVGVAEEDYHYILGRAMSGGVEG